MAAEDRAPVSPTKTKSGVDDDTVALQVQQFLDDWHYRIIHSSLGKSWNRKKVIQSALDIFTLNGASVSPEEYESFVDLEENVLVEELVKKMPDNLRQNFEFLALQLQMVVTVTTRIRNGLEKKDEEAVQQTMEESDGGVTSQVLKQGVVQASKEVAELKKRTQSWTKSTEKRLVRLQSAAETAERAQQQLLAVESQLEAYGVSQKGKSKKVLMGMAENQTKSLMHSVFSTWLGLTLKNKSERQIREKYEKQIRDAEDELIQYKEKQLANVKSVLMRKAQEGDKYYLTLCYDAWTDDVRNMKKEGGGLAERKMMEERLKAMKAGQADNTKKVMTRLAGDRDGTLKSLCWQAWVQFSAEYKKDKELEDQVKKQELALQEHLKKKKDEAKQVLDRMSAGSDSGLVALCMQGWVAYYQDVLKGSALEKTMAEQEGKFKSLKLRQGENAMNVQNRVNDQIKVNLLLKVMGWWAQETRINKVTKHLNDRLTAKRRQLNSVQTLFRSFAQQLEQGLGNIDGDSSGRRMTRKSEKKQSDGTHLPDIHARPAQA